MSDQQLTLQQALQKYAADLAKTISAFVDDTAVLEVRTLTTEASQVVTSIKQPPDVDAILTEGQAVLRAYTRVSLDGDTTILVPTDKDGNVNQAIWELHQTMVSHAQESRAAMFAALGEAAAATLKALGVTR